MNTHVALPNDVGVLELVAEAQPSLFVLQTSIHCDFL